MRKIKKVAIANRGEVAVRIIRACEELGIETVLLHSEVDVQTRAYRLANHRICIGPAPTRESYLNIQSNVQGALAAGADAIHPGFGFLSENADFAREVQKVGMIFIGPNPESTEMLGDKVSCKSLAKKLGLPLLPGYQGEDQDVSFLTAKAKEIGFPVIVKAAAGGGGRGMKILRSEVDCKELIESAQREALSAFGSAKVFLEKYLDLAKHIEFQIFGDATGKVHHLFDRECSVQRRHQKIIEEALSPSLSVELRRKMGEAAISIAQAAGYKGAGTVEFLLQDEHFYLMEVNTRLQVEHPVTEEVVGVDLVKAQILTAQGDPAFPAYFASGDRFTPHGHSIECRVYAENPFLGGVPSTGTLGRVAFPEGPGRRFEYGFEAGDEITSYYDPMIAKVIVHDETRTRAIQKMIRVLKDSEIFGVYTNIPYLIEILSHPEFVSGKMTTRFIETYFAEPLKEPELSDLEKALVQKARRSFGAELFSTGSGSSEQLIKSPWSQAWRGV